MRRVVLLLFAAAALACTTPAALPEGPPIGEVRHRAAIVPDELDRAAADLSVAVLASDPDRVESSLGALDAAERDLRPDGPPTGLVPAGIEAADAVRAPGRAGIAATERLLDERDDLDGASRARLERWLDDDPLALAKKRINEARYMAVARLFNAVSEPVGRSLLSTTMLPFTLGSALAHVTIDYAREDALPLQRRQALVHWERFAREYPNAPEVAEVAPEIEDYQAAWRNTQSDRAIALAEDALGEGRSDAAWFYARRARRYVDGERARELLQEAETRMADHRRALAVALQYGGPGDAESLARERSPVLVALSGASGVASPAPDAQLADETRFLRATELGRAGDDAAMWRNLEELADDPHSPMARHAEALLFDPTSNPYGAFVRARSAERWRTTRWVMFGPLTESPERGALGFADYLLDLPFRIQGAALFPIRLVQLPWRASTPGAAETAVHARQYLADNPGGAHAGEVRDWLEDFERDRENWVGALRVAEGRPNGSDAELDVLRERAAEQALRVASDEKRSDLRARLLGNVVRTFPETRAGAEAGRAAREQVVEHTPHTVRLSRGFLLENPDVAGPAGLDLSPALLDDDPKNGELHPDGVTWVGGRELSVAVLAESGDEDDPPRRLAAQLSEADLARLVARLEETSFRNSLLDSDDPLEPNAQRETVFERARIGLADDVDARPEAEARYSYRGMRERYGMVRSRESLLPVELVVQGELDSLTLGAFPRLKPPKTTPDAVLYK
jgi:hypothetical protein